MRLSLLDLGFFVSWTHVILAPYTKVEESFNLHAVHDLIMYGPWPKQLHNFDHFTFPGVVPRSFVGSILLAYVSYPIIWLASIFSLISTKLHFQIIIRLVLASFNACALVSIRIAISERLARDVNPRYGRTIGRLFTMITCTQFHLMFWMGRTLPNMFALILVNLAWSSLLRPSAHQHTGLNRAIGIIILTAIIFRAELALLLVPLVLESLFTNAHSIPKKVTELLKTGLMWGLPSLALTVFVDSYFWQRFPIWPKFSGIWFNVVEGKSAEWGISPPHAYFTTHLPKLLMTALPLALLGITIRYPTHSSRPNPRNTPDAPREEWVLSLTRFLAPSLAFMMLISCLGHKEWRFIIYVVPVFDVAAAVGAEWLIRSRSTSTFSIQHHQIGQRILAGLLLLNGAISAYLMSISLLNYPGGEAMRMLHEVGNTTRFNWIVRKSGEYRPYKLPPEQPPVSVHIDNLAAQTGASLFTHFNAPPYKFGIEPKRFYPFCTRGSPFEPVWAGDWTYHKTEQLKRVDKNQFTLLITDELPEVKQSGIGASEGINGESIKGAEKDRWDTLW